MSEPKPCETDDNKAKLAEYEAKLAEYEAKLAEYEAKLAEYKANPQIYGDLTNYEKKVNFLTQNIKNQNIFLQDYMCDKVENTKLQTLYEITDKNINNVIRDLEKQEQEQAKKQEQEQAKKQKKLKFKTQNIENTNKLNSDLELLGEEYQKKTDSVKEKFDQSELERLRQELTTKEQKKLENDIQQQIKITKQQPTSTPTSIQTSTTTPQQQPPPPPTYEKNYQIVQINIKPKHDLLQETISLLTNQKFITTYTAVLDQPIIIGDYNVTTEQPTTAAKFKAGKYYLYKNNAYYNIPETSPLSEAA